MLLSIILSAKSPEKPVSWRQALAHSVVLSLLFMVVYGGASWITSLRTDVGTWYYAWERFIPFVPLMIIPYMSIDLFFVAAPFICSNERELWLLSKRITLGILVAGCCFLIYPLKLAVERPSLAGWLGVVWDWFIGMDRPFNLLPSLHITLRTILADTYARHTRGALRVASSIWFSLIGFSTLLMHQHHIVDVIGGFILAAGCFYLINDVPLRLPMVRNSRIGWQYAGLGVCMAILCALTWPWGAILIWPIIAVAIVTLGYFHSGPGIFRKAYGRLPFSAKLVLAPVLAGQYVSWLYYKRQCRPWDEITPAVWIGRRLSNAEARAATDAGVTAVLDLSDAFSEARPFRELSHYRHIPVLDLTAPTPDQMSEAAAFIEEHATNGTVYVHCKIGYSRSAAVVAAWLLQTGRATSVDEAVSLLRSKRPTIVIRPEIAVALSGFAAVIPLHS
jgi:membrane-associated phospholipid phosphatase